MRRNRPLLAVILLVLLFGGTEGLWRLFGPKIMPPDRSPQPKPGETSLSEPNMVGDLYAGWRPKVGRQTSFGIPGGTTVNSLSMRGDEVSVKKSRPRVLVLGDSTIFGVMVADGDTFEARLGRMLPGVEVLNGGAPGYSTWQALQAFDDRFAALKPDMIVVGALWSDTQGADAPDATRYGGRRAPLLESSRAFVLIRAWARETRWGTPPRQVGSGLTKVMAPSLRVPMDDYETNLRAFATRAPHVAYLVLPCVNDLAAGKVGDFRDAYRGVMRETARELGAPLADVPPTFVGLDAAKMFYDEVHPTPAGHAKVAEVLAAALRPWAASAQ